MLKYIQEGANYEEAFCPLPYTKMIINAYGDITMCCHIGSEKLGNVLRDDLLEVWKSKKAEKIRKDTSNNVLARPCSNAPNCPFHMKKKIPFSFEVDPDYPIYLEICLPATHCNIGGKKPTSKTACLMCIRSHSMPWDQIDITDKICEKIKPLLPHIKKFCVLGIAEPFWKDEVFRIFEMINFKSYKDNITFETNHNVTCFGERTQDRFLKEVCKSNLQFSLDAATPETYVKIRRLDAYDLCIKNLKSWMKKKNFRHKVTIWNNINMLNVHEMKQMVQVAIDLNVESIYMLPTHNQNNKVHLSEIIINEKNVHIFQKNSIEAMELAKANKLDLRYVTPFDIIPPSNKKLKL